MNIFKALVLILGILWLSCVGGAFAPIPIEVHLTVTDESSNEINGLQCALSKDSVGLDEKVTDNEGRCILKTEQGHEDKYLSPDEFYRSLKVTITDIDGTDNGGDFETIEYRPKDGKDYNINITMIQK